MKVYMFFLYGPNGSLNGKTYRGITSDRIYHNDVLDYSLYAYTPMKEIKDFFQRSRNMNLFVLKTQEMSRESYEEFSDEHPDALLAIHPMETCCFIHHSSYHMMAPIVCTTAESDNILYYKNEILEDELLKSFESGNLSIAVKYFNKDMKKVCNKLFMNDIVSQLDVPIEEFRISDQYIIDEVSLYIHLYRNTFPEKNVMLIDDRINRFYMKKGYINE